jgi:Protein of unknown function (DUF2975)
MSNLSRIQRISRLMQRICTVAIVLIPIAVVGMWATFEWWGPTHPDFAPIPEIPNTLTLPTRLLAAAVGLLQASVAVFAVWRLRQLFALYAAGQIFTAGNARCLRHFAAAVCTFAIAKPITGALLSVVLTMNNPPGHRQLAITLGSSELTTLFIGCVFLVIAWIMGEAQALAEEQAEII